MRRDNNSEQKLNAQLNRSEGTRFPVVATSCARAAPHTSNHRRAPSREGDTPPPPPDARRSAWKTHAVDEMQLCAAIHLSHAAAAAEQRPAAAAAVLPLCRRARRASRRRGRTVGAAGSAGASPADASAAAGSAWEDEFSALGDRSPAPPLPLPPLSSPRRVVLVRHGESTWNAEGRMQGCSDYSELTEKARPRCRPPSLPMQCSDDALDCVRARPRLFLRPALDIACRPHLRPRPAPRLPRRGGDRRPARATWRVRLRSTPPRRSRPGRPRTPRPARCAAGR